jgi:hydroxyacylglutathione hydrolase
MCRGLQHFFVCSLPTTTRTRANTQLFMRSAASVAGRVAARAMMAQTSSSSSLSSSSTPLPRLLITPIPLFADNYAWRVEDRLTGKVVLVDPADPEPCLAAVSPSLSTTLVGILTTHHHRDHSGGNQAIAEAWAKDDARQRQLTGDAGEQPRRLMVVAGAADGDKVPAATHFVGDGEAVDFGHGALRFTALHTPCHTRGHTCFVTSRRPDDASVNEDESGAVFTGDTLFGAGCGRFFEGAAADMATSLGKLSSLPPSTRVFFGHEYTVANLRFCLHADPGNSAAVERMERAQRQREAGAPTAPSTIGEELLTNVFLRTGEPGVRAFTHGAGEGAQLATDVEVLGKLREAKNGFT